MRTTQTRARDRATATGGAPENPQCSRFADDFCNQTRTGYRKEADRSAWRPEFTKLKARQKAVDVTVDIYRITKGFPPDERFGMTSQLRRAVNSIPSCIAEGFGRRRPRDKAHFYAVAHSSGEELKSEILVSHRLGYIAEPSTENLLIRLDEICRMLYGRIESMEARLESS